MRLTDDCYEQQRSSKRGMEQTSVCFEEGFGAMKVLNGRAMGVIE